MKPSARKKSQRGSKCPGGPAGHGAAHQQRKRGVQGFMARNHNARRTCRIGMLVGSLGRECQVKGLCPQETKDLARGRGSSERSAASASPWPVLVLHRPLTTNCFRISIS